MKQLTDSPTDTTPQDLAHCRRILRQWHVQNTETTRPRLTDNDILLPEELSHPRPHPCMADDILTQRVLSREPRLEWRNGERLGLGGEWFETGDKLGDELLHADGVEAGVLDAGVVGVEFDGVGLRDTVGEVTGVEVGLEATNGDDEFSALDLLFDLGARDGADVDLQNATIRKQPDKRR